jgi:hypothetical protein
MLFKMHTILCSILSAAMLAAGVLAQLVPEPPFFNNTLVLNGDKDGALALHNYYRGRLGVPALTWCENLTDIAQVAAAWSAAADIPETPNNIITRAIQNSTYSLQAIYLSPGTRHLFGAFYQATLAFWDDRTHYHGEIIPDGNFFKYSPYSE